MRIDELILYRGLEQEPVLRDAARLMEAGRQDQLKEKEADKARVSMRSKGTDVSAVALKFGGGGHVKAAGCGLEKPFGEAKALLQQAIDQALSPTDTAGAAEGAGEEK